MHMFVIYSGKDGPVALAYTEVVANKAVEGLRRLNPGTRCWQKRSHVRELPQMELEVLETLEAAEVVPMFRIASHDGIETGGYLQDTLRGLVRRWGMGNSQHAKADGLSLEEARGFVQKVLQGDYLPITGRFRVEDIAY